MILPPHSYYRIPCIIILTIFSQAGYATSQATPGTIKQYAERIDNIHKLYTEHFDHIENTYSAYTTPYTQLSYDLSHDMQHVIKSMCDDICRQLGEKPCQMCLIVFGSMARYEAGFFTDLEIGMLLETKTPETVKYAHDLTQELVEWLYVINAYLGKEIITLDMADHTPPFKLPFYQSIQRGTRLLIATPCELTEFFAYSYPDIFDKMEHEDQKRIDLLIQSQLHPDYTRMKPYFDEIYTPLQEHEEHFIEEIAVLSRNISYLWGDKDMLDTYYTHLSSIIDKDIYGTPLHKTQARTILDDDIHNHAYIKNLQEMPDTIDIKRKLYRFPQECIASLCLYANITENNSIEALEQLYHEGWINKACRDELTAYMDYMIGMRLRQQRYLQRQASQIIRDYAPILPPDISRKIDTIYLHILRKTYAIARKFINGDESAFLQWRSRS